MNPHMFKANLKIIKEEKIRKKDLKSKNKDKTTNTIDTFLVNNIKYETFIKNLSTKRFKKIGILCLKLAVQTC